MISVKSTHTVAETADRLEKILASKGMTVFKRIDHAAMGHKKQVKTYVLPNWLFSVTPRSAPR